MKKKIFLSLILASILSLIFAVGVSAASTNEFGTVEKSNTIDLTGMAQDADLRVVLFDGTEYHTYPSQYIVTSATDITLNFDKINAAFGKSYTKASVIRIEIPRHVLKIVGGWFNYSNNDNLVEVFFPSDSNVYHFAWGCFEDNGSLQKINIPASLTEYGGQNHFAKCSSLTEITFDEGYSVSYIPLNFLQSCKSLEAIVFPNCVTEIRGGAFSSCAKLKTIVLGNSLQTMAGAMSDCATSGSTWYLPASFYSSSVTSEPPSNMFHWAGGQTNGVSGNNNNPKNITFVYTGTKADAEALMARFKAADASTGENCVGLSRLYNATLCTEAEYKELTGKNVGEGATGYYLVYGYSACDAFYNGNHAETEAEQRFEGDAYLTSYCEYSTCPRCQEGTKTEICAPLFVNKGYSREIDGAFFDFGFAANKEAIALYEEITGETLSYGVIAANKSLSQNGALFDENGKAIEGAIAMSFDATSYDTYNVKITGISEEFRASELYCCAYVYEAGTTSYIGEKVTELASLISYDKVPTDDTEE